MSLLLILVVPHPVQQIVDHDPLVSRSLIVGGVYFGSNYLDFENASVAQPALCDIISVAHLSPLEV